MEVRQLSGLDVKVAGALVVEPVSGLVSDVCCSMLYRHPCAPSLQHMLPSKYRFVRSLLTTGAHGHFFS